MFPKMFISAKTARRKTTAAAVPEGGGRMADATGSIFTKKATEKLRSPDDLDKYVQVTNPSVWVALAACIALLAGLLAWGVFGSVTTQVSTTGTVIDGTAVCLLSAEDVAKVHEGDTATVGGSPMSVGQIAKVPFSRDEAVAYIPSDYLVETLMKDKWAYVVSFSGDTSNLEVEVPLSVSITTERIPPISLILGGNKS